MRKGIFSIAFLAMMVFPIESWASGKSIDRFAIEPGSLELRRLAQPNTYFDKVGRKFAILGYESGSFEAWAYPLKLLRNFEFSFLLESSTLPIQGKDIVRYVSATPEATTLTFVYQSFTMMATYVAAIEEAGAVIFLAVDTTEPMSIVCSFLPVLQPMWPAGLGGQYASWDNELKAYLISEPTRKNHGFIGSPEARGISYTPAHMLSDAANQFKIEIRDKDAAKGAYIPVILAGGKGRREDIRKIYEKLEADPESVYRTAAEHYRRLRQNTLRAATPDEKFNLAFEWAKVAHDNLMVDNPDLGKGLVAGLGTSGTGGRPGFGWFFGGDAYMNSLGLTSYGAFAETKTALQFTQKWQREDGKMAHELSQAAGYINWFKDYPYGYIHGDTTPFYIAACYEYLQMSGDVDFVKQSWPSLKRAYAWCLSTDEDGDGLMDNSRAGLGALEFGALTGIQTDIFLAAAWVRAAYCMEQLAQVAGDSVSEKNAREHFARAQKALDSKFWDEENGQYTYAFNDDGNQVKEITPWCSVPLAWGQGDERRGVRTLEKINAADLTTDWGVRMLSSKSRTYEPLNYNYGAVWPFLSGWAATALYKKNYSLQGFGLLRAAVRHTFDNGLGYVTELFSGSQNIWPQEAVAHQGFSSSGVIFPFVRGLLGLEGDVLKKEIRFEPRFPADWKEVKIDNYKIGDAIFSLCYFREEKTIRAAVVSEKASDFKLIFAPALGLGSKILGARVNGKFVPAKVEIPSWAQAVQPVVEVRLTGNDLIELDIEPIPELLPPGNESRTGDTSQGLRIIKMELEGRRLKVIIEGLAGRSYRIEVVNANLIQSVAGAKLNGSYLIIKMPHGAEGEYIRHEFALNLFVRPDH